MTKAQLVKELRARTNAGMNDCIKALDASNNDIELSIEWLRKQGTIKAAKKADAVATEGAVVAASNSDGSKVVVFEINSQTDFVATNEKFVEFTEEVSKSLLEQAKTDADVEKVQVNGKSILTAGEDLTAIIGEKISFRRATILNKEKNQTIGSYTHMNKKIATALVFDNELDAESAKQVAMHVAAMKPKYISKDHVDSAWLEKETEIIKTQTQEEIMKIEDAKVREGKLNNMEKVIVGRINKTIKEICLVNQSFIIDPSVTVEEFLKRKNVNILTMINYILGEGIEKKECDFASEVAEQMKK